MRTAGFRERFALFEHEKELIKTDSTMKVENSLMFIRIILSRKLASKIKQNKNQSTFSISFSNSERIRFVSLAKILRLWAH
jgi:tagatose-1,6-bisphosphate aldolase non-catalytic subunit AgaZ/GatZ